MAIGNWQMAIGQWPHALSATTGSQTGAVSGLLPYHSWRHAGGSSRCQHHAVLGVGRARASVCGALPWHGFTCLTIRSSRCHFTAAIFFGMFVLICGRAVARLNSGVSAQKKYIFAKSLFLGSSPRASLTDLRPRSGVFRIQYASAAVTDLWLLAT